uniref:Uncharacterized protein n=1 Tax=Romanomermis culicivorax TaxID=13658 RepID=A0A915IXP5_ROMCU
MHEVANVKWPVRSRRRGKKILEERSRLSHRCACGMRLFPCLDALVAAHSLLSTNDKAWIKIGYSVRGTSVFQKRTSSSVNGDKEEKSILIMGGRPPHQDMGQLD